jgi:tetratricopeptide (TPR) repeat protein
VLAGLAMISLLVGGVVGTTIGLVRAVAEAAQKEQARKAEEENFQRSRQAVDDFFTTVSQSTLFDVPGLQPLRKDLLEKALRYYQEMAEKRGDDPAILAGLAVAHFRLSSVYYEVNRNDDAIAATDAGVDVTERLLRQHPAASELHRKLAGSWKGTRPVQAATQVPKDLAAAIRVLMRFANLWEKFVEQFPDELGFQVDLASRYYFLGALEQERQRADESLVFYQKAIAILERLRNQKEPMYRDTLAGAYGSAGHYAARAGRPVAAEWFKQRLALHEELAAEFPSVPHYQAELAQSLGVLGGWHARAGRDQEAIAAYRRSSDLMTPLITRFPEVASYSERQGANLYDLGSLLHKADQPKEAEKVRRRAVELYTKLVADYPRNPVHREQLGHSYRWLAFDLEKNGQPAEAAKAFHRAIGTLEKLVDDFPDVSKYRGLLADTYGHSLLLLADTGRAREAEQISRKALELNPDDPVAYYRLALLGLHLGDRNDYRKTAAEMLKRFGDSPNVDAAYLTGWTCALVPDAVTDWQPVVRLAEKALAADRKNSDKLLTVGAVLYRAGRFPEAARRLAEAAAAFKGTPNPRCSPQYSRLFLAMAQHRLGQAQEAKASLQDAVKAIDRPRPDGLGLSPSVPWNRRLTLQLLRREAEELAKKAEH